MAAPAQAAALVVHQQPEVAKAALLEGVAAQALVAGMAVLAAVLVGLAVLRQKVATAS
jgi:hypothetical protein